MPIPEMDFDPAAYETGDYGDILRMIRAGATDGEIAAKHPTWTADLLSVCRKIANGTTTRLREYEVGEKRQRSTRTYNGGRPKRTSEQLAAEVCRLRSMGCSWHQVQGLLNMSGGALRRYKDIERGKEAAQHENV